MHQVHDVKPSDVRSTTVNIPQLETLRSLAAEHEKEIADLQKREEDRVYKYSQVHADIYDRLEKLQLQLEDKTRNEAALTLRLKKAESKIHFIENSIGDIDKIGKIDDRVRHLESQFKMETPSPLQEHYSMIKSVQRSIYDSDRKVQESLSAVKQNVSTLSLRQNSFEEVLSELRKLIGSVEEKKIERIDVETALSTLTDKQRELKVQIGTCNDTLDDLLGKIKNVSEEFHGELEVQRKRMDSEIGNCNVAITDTRSKYEIVRQKLSSFEALIETVGVMERQIEDWNIERNRLNEKVDTVLQRRLRELDRMVQSHEINKMDRYEMDRKAEEFSSSFASKEDLERVDIEMERLEFRITDIDLVTVNNNITALEKKNALFTAKFEEQDLTIENLLQRFQETAKKMEDALAAVPAPLDLPAPTVVEVAPAPMLPANSEFDMEAWQSQYQEIRSHFGALEELRKSVEYMRQEVHKLALRVAELNSTVTNIANGGGVGRGDGGASEQQVAEVRRRLDIVEHVKIEKEYMKKQLWAVMEQLRKEMESRIEKLAFACGELIDDLRGDQGRLAKEVQKWIKNFLRLLSNAGGGYNENPAAAVRCLVCEREPAFNIDYNSPDLAFKPTALLGPVANQHGQMLPQRGTNGENGNTEHRASANVLLNYNAAERPQTSDGAIMPGRGLEADGFPVGNQQQGQQGGNVNFMRQTYHGQGQLHHQHQQQPQHANTADHGNLRGSFGYSYGGVGAVTGATAVPKKRPGSAPSHRRGSSSGSGFHAALGNRRNDI